MAEITSQETTLVDFEYPIRQIIDILPVWPEGPLGAKVVFTDLDSVEHEVMPTGLSQGEYLNVTLTHKAADQFSVTLEDYDATYRAWLVKGCLIDIYIDTFIPPTTLQLHGMVELVKAAQPKRTTVLLTVTGRDLFSVIINERKVTETYVDTEVSLIVKDLMEKYAPEVDTTVFVFVTTHTPEDIRFPYRPLKEVLDRLAILSGCTYRCDPFMFLHWKEAQTESAGIDYEESDLDRGPEKIDSLYPIKNRVYVLGGDYMQADQEQTVIAATKNSKDKWYAQAFTPGTYNLDQISLHLKRTGDPDDLDVEIRNDDAGDPGDILGSATMDSDFVGTTATWRPLRFKSIQIMEGVKHWIVLKKVGDVANYYEWYHDNGVAGENADSDDGVAWNVNAASYQFTYRTQFSVPILAVKENEASADIYKWREEVIEDKAIVSRIVAREVAQAKLDELDDTTPVLKKITILAPIWIPERGKMAGITIPGLLISAVDYEVKEAQIRFRGGTMGAYKMTLGLGKDASEMAEWLYLLKQESDRAKVAASGIDMGVLNLIRTFSDTATAQDSLGSTVQNTGTFLIDTARIDFSDIGP